MVEAGRFPAGGGVACTTSSPKVALVSIIRCMAGIAVAGSALENMIDMTTLAGDIDVLTCQFECR